MASQLEASWEFLQSDVFSQCVCEKKGKSLGQSRVLHYLRSAIKGIIDDLGELVKWLKFHWQIGLCDDC